MENSNYNPNNYKQGNNNKENSSTGKMENEGYNKKIIIAMIMGIIIGFGSFWLWDKGRDSALDSKNADNEEVVDDIDNEGTIGVSTNIIEVSDQLAGSMVNIDKVVLDELGWVAIHDDESGELGKILGAQKFSKGENIGVVELLRNTVAGNTYHVVLRSDDGVEGFSSTGDAILTDSLGNIILSSFKALSTDI